MIPTVQRALAYFGTIGSMALLIVGCDQSSGLSDSGLLWSPDREGEPQPWIHSRGEELWFRADGSFELSSNLTPEGGITGTASVAEGFLTLSYTLDNERDEYRDEQTITAPFLVINDMLCFDHCVPFQLEGQTVLRRSRYWHHHRETNSGHVSIQTEERWSDEIELVGNNQCFLRRYRSSDETSTQEIPCTYVFVESDRRSNRRGYYSITYTNQPGETEVEWILNQFGVGWIPAEDESRIYRRVPE